MSVPREVILACAAPVTVAAVPDALPVNAPTKDVDVMLVAPVTTPPSTLIVPSSNIAEPPAGSIFIAAPESRVRTPAESISTVPSAVIWILAAAAAVSTVTSEKAPLAAAVIVTVSLVVGVNVITSSVMTVVPTVKSVLASTVVSVGVAVHAGIFDDSVRILLSLPFASRLNCEELEAYTMSPVA